MLPDKPYQVYVLQNPAGKLYIGLSEDISLRLQQHNAGSSDWTKKQLGRWSLIWSSQPMTLTAARKLENLLKRQKGGSGFYRMTGLPQTSGS